MGDDWNGKFDYLETYGVEVVYLPRTPEISGSQIKNDLQQVKFKIDWKIFGKNNMIRGMYN